MSVCASVLAALVLLCGADEPERTEPLPLPPTVVTERQTATTEPPAPYVSWEAWRTAPRRARTPSPEPWVEADRLRQAATVTALRAADAAEEERAQRARSEAARGETDEPVPTTDRPDLEEQKDSEPTHFSRSVWDDLADCESGNWINGGASFETGSARWDYGVNFAHEGYEQFQGGVNFHPRTWLSYKDPGMPNHAGRASREQQIVVAERVLAAQGWGAWPNCARKLGLR